MRILNCNYSFGQTLKKGMLLFTLFLAVVTTTTAQHFRAGFTAGIAQTDVDGTDNRDNDNDFHKSGFTFGAFVNRKLGTYNELQLELNYIHAGSMQPPDSTNNNYFKLELNYVNASFLLKHYFHFPFFKQNGDKFDAELGLWVGQLVNYDYNVNGTDLTLPTGFLNSAEVSAFVGLTYNFTPHIALSYRYSNSLTSALNHSQASLAYPYYGSFNAGHNLENIITLRFTFGSDGNSMPETTPTPSTDSGQ